MLSKSNALDLDLPSDDPEGVIELAARRLDQEHARAVAEIDLVQWLRGPIRNALAELDQLALLIFFFFFYGGRSGW